MTECDWRTSARNIPEPWEDHSRTFSNGAVRLTLLDTLEPAAAAFYLMLLSPPYSELGDRQCVVIGLPDMGFSSVDITGLTADYDPAQGLILTLPVGRWVPDADAFLNETLHVTLNQSTGAVDTTLSR